MNVGQEMEMWNGKGVSIRHPSYLHVGGAPGHATSDLQSETTRHFEFVQVKALDIYHDVEST